MTSSVTSSGMMSSYVTMVAYSWSPVPLRTYIHVHSMYILYAHVSSVGATHSGDAVGEEDHQLVEGLPPDGRELQQATEPDRHKATHVTEPSMTTWHHSHIDTGQYLLGVCRASNLFFHQRE